MAYISFQPSDYFNTVLWSGNSTGDNANQNITGVGFQPDLFWNKTRNQAENNIITDVLRGTNKFLRANDTTAQYTPTCNQTPISDGFTATGDEGGEFNNNGYTYVTWNWKAGGSGSSNTDGSITSTVSSNTTSGFSIVKWTGTSTNGTIGHGLGVVPKMIIVKRISGGTGFWIVYHSALGNNNEIYLNATNASGSSSAWQNTDPTSSVFYVSGAGNDVNGSGDYIAYCFAEKKGFSKFGSYTGNGSTDGTFVYTGFKPAFVMYKNSSVAGGHWQIHDTKRLGYNGANKVLRANLTNAEADDEIDILSNGFKARNASNNNNNWSGVTYLYMAFAEEPLVASNGVPATAR